MTTSPSQPAQMAHGPSESSPARSIFVKTAATRRLLESIMDSTLPPSRAAVVGRAAPSRPGCEPLAFRASDARNGRRSGAERETSASWQTERRPGDQVDCSRQAIARAEAMMRNAARPVSAPTVCLCKSGARRGLGRADARRPMRSRRGPALKRPHVSESERRSPTPPSLRAAQHSPPDVTPPGPSASEIASARNASPSPPSFRTMNTWTSIRFPVPWAMRKVPISRYSPTVATPEW